jgi:alpha-L-rhamnosidase
VAWTDGAGATAPAASARFSTGLLSPAAWQGAAYLSSAGNGSLNTYRAEFTLAALPARARLYVIGLGYAKTWLNGALTDDHELGTFTTFEQRVLYDVVDVTPRLLVGCNALGVMLGHGWFAQPKVHSGPRQFMLLLSLTDGAGAVTYLRSAAAAGGAPGALLFSATQGPVLADDIYEGETYDARIARALDGWAACGFSPAPGAWQPAQPPAVSPATHGALVGAHTLVARTDASFSPAAITQPLPGVFVFDMGQNIAGQSELRVADCPAGTNITLIHNEICNADGTVNRNLARMQSQYICAGGDSESYRTMFTYMGFRYVRRRGGAADAAPTTGSGAAVADAGMTVGHGACCCCCCEATYAVPARLESPNSRGTTR